MVDCDECIYNMECGQSLIDCRARVGGKEKPVQRRYVLEASGILSDCMTKAKMMDLDVRNAIKDAILYLDRALVE